MKENISADVIWRAAGADIDKDIPLAHFCVSFKSENIKT